MKNDAFGYSSGLRQSQIATINIAPGAPILSQSGTDAN